MPVPGLVVLRMWWSVKDGVKKSILGEQGPRRAQSGKLQTISAGGVPSL